MFERFIQNKLEAEEKDLHESGFKNFLFNKDLIHLIVTGLPGWVFITSSGQETMGYWYHSITPLD